MSLSSIFKEAYDAYLRLQEELRHQEPPKPKNVRVLFVLKYRDSYGESTNKAYSSGLFNSANFVSNMLKSQGMVSNVIEVVDNNSIERVVVANNPTHVIIEAIWVTPDKMKLLAAMYPKIKWIVRVHSNTTFIANEGVAVSWLSEYLVNTNNIYISVNSKKFVNDLAIILKAKPDHHCIHLNKILYLPNYYEFTRNQPPKYRTDTYAPVINVGCFGAIRPLKNQLIQAVAAIHFATGHGKKLRFHINAERLEQGGNNVLKNIEAVFRNTNHELVMHGWLPRPEFLKLVASMDMCMQVSISETFNIVAADSVNENVPIVVSPEIDWIASEYQADPMNVHSIVEKLSNIWMSGNENRHTRNWRNLQQYNSASERQWVAVLNCN